MLFILSKDFKNASNLEQLLNHNDEEIEIRIESLRIDIENISKKFENRIYNIINLFNPKNIIPDKTVSKSQARRSLEKILLKANRYNQCIKQRIASVETDCTKSIQTINIGILISKSIQDFKYKQQLANENTSIIYPSRFTIFTFNNHLILSDENKSCLHVIHASTHEYIKEIELKSKEFICLCENENDNVLCVVYRLKHKLLLFNNNYEIIKEMKLPKNGAYGAIAYNHMNSMYYLLNDVKLTICMINKDLNNIAKQVDIHDADLLWSIKVINNKIFVCNNHKNTLKSKILVYDNQLNSIICSFGENILYYPVDIIVANQGRAAVESNNNGFIYITDALQHCIVVFTANEFKFIKKIKLDELPCFGLILNNQLILNHNFRTLVLYDIIQ